MFKHDKALLHEVKVDSPNPNYAAMLQEQLGGPQGELKAAMQYLSQSFRIKDPQIKDLFLDIAAEELSHMEMIATTINLLNGHELNANNATIGAVEAHVLTGLTPMLSNASGQLWTAAYVTKPEIWLPTSYPISRLNNGPKLFMNTCTVRSTTRGYGKPLIFC
jgi:Mn-containing catalase